MQAVTRALASMLVELLPLEAWLLVFAAYDGLSINQAAAPFWVLLVAMALAWWVARATGGGRAALSAGAVPFALMYVVLLRVSPAAYGNEGSFFDLTWLGTLANDFATSSHRVSALLGLLLLLALVWWRGTMLGVDPESASGNLRRFTVFFGGLLLALAGAVAAQPQTQDGLSAALTLILLGEVFFGLVDAALARVAATRASAGNGGASDGPWVRSSLGLAAGVVGIALLVSVVFNFNSFLVLLSYLGPVGGFISFILTWLINGFTNLLGMLLSPIITPLQGKVPLPHFLPVAPTQSACHVVNGVQVCPHPPQANGLVDLLGHLMLIVCVLVVVALIAFATRAALVKRRAPETGADEDRESLDAQSLFAAQLRALFARRARRGKRIEDTLPRGSIRYLYREMLRAAHARGLDRRPAETPDEFASRLGKTAPIAMFSTTEGADLRALSDAYDDARYADREPDPPERERLQAGTTRLARLLRGQERGRR